MIRIPRHLASPPLDTQIGEWWQDHYDHFFVVLNPFFRVSEHHSSTTQYGTIRTDRAEIDDIIGFIEKPPTRPFKAPDNFDDVIKREGIAIGWQKIQDQLGVFDFNRFATTVWLWAVDASRRPDFDKVLAFKLDTLQAETGIYRPEEDILPAILEPMIFDYLFALGLPEVTLWNEWRDKSQSCLVHQFARDMPCVQFVGGQISAIAADGLLLSWQHEDVAGMLALTQEMRAKVNPESYFEGFWVGGNSYCDVFNPVDLFERKPVRPKS